MISEPSNQDLVIRPPARWRSKKLWLALLATTSLTVAAGTLISDWSKANHSIKLERLQTAQVTRGTLVRDALVNGHLVAAISPTLYAPAAATVSLSVKAGDSVLVVGCGGDGIDFGLATGGGKDGRMRHAGGIADVGIGIQAETAIQRQRGGRRGDHAGLGLGNFRCRPVTRDQRVIARAAPGVFDGDGGLG